MTDEMRRRSAGGGGSHPNADDLTTYAEKTWCPGCGNFGILNAARGAIRKLGERGIDRGAIMMAAGIGQHAKMFDYLALSGFYSLHGRAIATAQGMKLGNPDLKVLTFVGDGDTMGEGLAHLIFAAKRNADVTVLMHNNGVYALTAGQRSPLSDEGYKGPSTPHGNTERPLNALALVLEAGATFVARGYSGNIGQLSDLIVAGIMHQGFSFIDVLQPCVTFNNRYSEYNELVEPVEGQASTLDEALSLSRMKSRLPTGILYEVKQPGGEVLLDRGRNPVMDHPSREERLKQVAALLAIES